MKKIHILCPEYVPLENKGEEAIIRGTIDVIFGKQEELCEYHMVFLNLANPVYPSQKLISGKKILESAEPETCLQLFGYKPIPNRV